MDGRERKRGFPGRVGSVLLENLFSGEVTFKNIRKKKIMADNLGIIEQLFCNECIN